MTVALIVAASANDVIGRGRTLPWHLPDDLRRFKRLTAGHPIVLGRLTHESIVARLGRPLPGRTSVVVSSQPPATAEDGVIWATSVAAALAAARAGSLNGGEVFVGGGTSVYEQALPHADRIYLTRLHRDVDGDTAMPPGWLDGFTLVAREDRDIETPGGGYSWLDYEREPGS
ncbi:MAG TPA: dihydrofolate reductase [Streptosporangiaceae bacterium]